MSQTTRGACPDAELITGFVDRELDLVAHDSVVSHLAACDACRALVEAERSTSSMLKALSAPVPSSALAARLLAVADDSDDELAARRGRGRAPAFLGAAASVAVFMIGAFAFIGASAQTPAVATPNGSTAIVPVASQLTQEHAATSAQAGVGAPGFDVVSASLSSAGTAAVPTSMPVVVP